MIKNENYKTTFPWNNLKVIIDIVSGSILQQTVQGFLWLKMVFKVFMQM